MRNKKILFMSILLFMMVLSIGAISAQDADKVISAQNADYSIASTSDEIAIGDSEPSYSGSVSGGVDVVTENPWNTTGELSYDIPQDAKTIKSADVYVNMYGGSAKNTYGANANVTIEAGNGVKIYNEALWIEEGSADGTVYTVNDHTTKCYSDYMIHYNVTGLLNGLNGTNLKIKVDTFKMENKSFDGRIKLIGLVLAYDDGDDDIICYWVNDNQIWTNSNTTLTFDTSALSNALDASLTNIALSSSDATYKLNGEFLTDAEHKSGNYYQYNKWDVTDYIGGGNKTYLTAFGAAGSYGVSYKNVLSVLTAQPGVMQVSVSLNTEYTSVKSAYAGTNNTLTVKVNTNNAGKYTIKLLADGVVVDSKEVDLVSGDNTFDLTDQTIRPVDASTVNGANNTKVTYATEVKYKNITVADSNITVPVLYNGNLGYDLEYNITGFEFFGDFVVNGDVVIDVKDVGSYLAAAAMNRTDVWNVNLGNDSTVVKSLIFVPYNWFNGKTYTEDVNMFNVTFNGATIVPIAWYRDQGNLGNYGKYGYGVFVYDVTALTVDGNNSLVLNKVNPTPAVYPSVLLYMYNTTGSNVVKTVSILNGADLLSNGNNNAGRIVKTDTVINVNPNVANATLYVLAASAQVNESDIVVNGNVFSNVWSGTGSTTDLFETDITGIVKDSNAISFVATGSTILALPQIIVTTNVVADVSLNTEYTSVKSAYAGTNNTLTVKVNTNKAGKYTIKLLADGVVVDSKEVDLVSGDNTLALTDQTIRPLDATTVNGANNTKVTYAAEVIREGSVVGKGAITVPVLYNGNLGYDLEYNITGFEFFGDVAITGDVVIDVKDVSSYLAASAMNRTDVWNVNLGSASTLVKSVIFVPYNWFNAKTYTEDANMFNVTFNGATIVPIAWYRDQGNLGNYGKYDYGVFVYDVTGLTVDGNNSLVLNKVNPTPAVYPSVLLYMYNTTGSNVVKTVSILNGADLLSNSNNNAGRVAKADTVIKVDTKDITDATLYVLAASAQAGESDIIVNGNVFGNVWNGTASTTDLFQANITGIVKDSNAISFVATGSTILALPQIIVTTQKAPEPQPVKIKTVVTPKALTTTYNSGKAFTVTVKDANKKAIKGLKLTLNIYTGKKYITRTITTNAKGVASLASASKLAIGTHKVVITSKNTKYDVKKTQSKIKVNKAKTTVKAPKVIAKVKKSKYFNVKVINKATKKVVSGIKVKVKVYTGKKAKTYAIKTNKKGIAKLNTKSLKVGTHKVVITSGDSKYVISAKSAIVIKK